MRRRELFWGCVLIIAGFLFLLGNLFHIDVGDFLWPLFLIALGGRILWRALRKANVIAGETVIIPLEDADEARIEVRYGAGKLFIHSDAGAGELLNGTFGGGLEREIHREGPGVTRRAALSSRGVALDAGRARLGRQPERRDPALTRRGGWRQ